MSCPVCGDPEASIGFTTVWCPNVNCSNFDRSQLDEVLALLEEDRARLALEEYDGISDSDMESMWEGIMEAINDSFGGLSSGPTPTDDDPA